MRGAVCVAVMVCVALLGNATNGVPPGSFQQDDSAIASRYMLQKEAGFVNSVQGVLESLQERFLPGKPIEKHRARRAFMVQCCGFYRCINGNKRTTTTCQKDPASFTLPTLPAIGLPTLPPVDTGLLGAIGSGVDSLLGGGLPTLPDLSLPTLPPLPAISLPGDTITILGAGPCPTGYVPKSNATSAAAPAGGLLGGLLGG